MLDFKFSNALMHYFRSDAPGGFLPKFALSYLVAAIVVGGVSMIVMRPIINFYVELFALAGSGELDSTDPAAIDAMMADQIGDLGQSGLLMIVVLGPLALAMWAAFEANIQRRYIRKSDFRLQFGNDEWRLMAVGLVVYMLLFVVMFVAMIPMGIVVAIGASTGNESATLASVGLGYVIFLGAMFWYLVRISAASAMTIRDEQVRIFESFRVTKGRFWPIFGALMIIWIGFYILQTVIYGLGAFTIIAQFADLLAGGSQPDLADITAKLQTPAVVGTIAMFMIMLAFSYGLFMILMGGPGALAALNDPDRTFKGNDPTDVFS